MRRERIKIGVVGLNFGKYIIEKQLLEGPGTEFFELAAVCDVNREKADAAAIRYGVKAYHSLDALIASDAIPAIALMTGPVDRPQFIQDIVRAGKDVMTTKPFALDADKALELLEEARALGRTVHLNSPAPVPPADIKVALDWWRHQDLGQAVGARWETWCNYCEQADGSWYDNPELCPVAPIFRLGIYGINDLLFFFNSPEQVQVMCSSMFTGRPTPDNAQLTVKFRSGAIASVYVSFSGANMGINYPDRLTINFERGTIYRNAIPRSGATAVAMTLERSDGQGGSVIEQVSVPVATRSGNYQWDNFYRSITSGRLADEVSPRQIADGIKIIETMRRSEKSGKSEKVI